MKIPIIFISCLCVLILSCEKPTKPEEKTDTAWVTQLTEVITAGSTMDDEFIYFASRNTTLYKIRKKDGYLQKTGTFASWFGEPVIYGNTIYTPSVTGTIFSYNKDSLTLNWKRTGFLWNAIPAVNDQYVFVAEENRISALEKKNGTTVWATETSGKCLVNPIIDETRIYFVTAGDFQKDGYLYCINGLNGNIIFQNTYRYMRDTNQFGGSMAGVTVWQNYLYVPIEDRYMYCLDKYTGEVVWKFLMDAQCETPPRVSEGILYVGTLNRTCYAIDAVSGTKVWSYQTVGSIHRIPPQFYADKVAFISGALIVLNKWNGKLVADISPRTGDKYGYYTALWDKDGKIYITGFEDLGPGRIVTYKQF